MQACVFYPGRGIIAGIKGNPWKTGGSVAVVMVCRRLNGLLVHGTLIFRTYVIMLSRVVHARCLQCRAAWYFGVYYKYLDIYVHIINDLFGNYCTTTDMSIRLLPTNLCLTCLHPRSGK